MKCQEMNYDEVGCQTTINLLSDMMVQTGVILFIFYSELGVPTILDTE